MKISRRAKLTSAALITLAICIPATSAAQAAPKSLQPAALSSCTGGATYTGTAQQTISTGVLKVGFCNFSNGAVGTVNIVFQKTSGATQDLDFGWNFDNSTGGAKTQFQSDAGDFTESSGQSKTFQWVYASPGIGAHSSAAECFQGSMGDLGSGVIYYTPTICP